MYKLSMFCVSRSIYQLFGILYRLKLTINRIMYLQIIDLLCFSTELFGIPYCLV